MDKMEIIKREIAREVDGFRISVIKFKDGTYELAILAEDWFGNWELDYSIFNDVLKAETEMEVYGTIQHIIAPAYYEEYNVDFTI